MVEILQCDKKLNYIGSGVYDWQKNSIRALIPITLNTFYSVPGTWIWHQSGLKKRKKAFHQSPALCGKNTGSQWWSWTFRHEFWKLLMEKDCMRRSRSIGIKECSLEYSFERCQSFKGTFRRWLFRGLNNQWMNLRLELLFQVKPAFSM